MNLTKALFIKYFKNKMSQDELFKNIGIKEIGFEKCLLDKIFYAYEQEDAEMIEYLVFTIYLGEEKINLSLFLDILNRLILCKWHNQHENIVLLLQKISSPESVKYLYKAIFMELDYLKWDDNFAFEKKCIHAMAKCNSQEAVRNLRHLATNENEIIKLCAERQLQKMQDKT